LLRYLAEFDFLYDRRNSVKMSDTKLHNDLLTVIGGKRHTYRWIDEDHQA